MNRYLEKIAEKNDGISDVLRTGTIFGLGTAGNVLSHKLVNMGGKVGSARKAALIGGGIGLAADYGAVKLNHLLNKKLEKKAMKQKWVGDPLLVELADRQAESREMVDLTRKTGRIMTAVMEYDLSKKHTKE